jgi:hypothetical protein
MYVWDVKNKSTHQAKDFKNVKHLFIWKFLVYAKVVLMKWKNWMNGFG